MAVNNRKCVVCGLEYEYCNTCHNNNDHNLTRWKTTFHDENCRDIYRAISAYRAGQIPIEEARTMLNKCDVTIDFVDGIRAAVNEIVPLESPQVEEKVDEPVQVEQVTIEPIEEKEDTVEMAPTQEVRQPYEYKKYGKKNRKR